MLETLIDFKTENKMTKENIFKVFSEIKLDIEGSNLGQVGWRPSESDLNYMNQDEFDLSVKKYNAENSKVLFTNIRLDWDSCDCEGWCSHGGWVYQLTVINGADKNEIDVVDGDSLEFYNNGKFGRIPVENATIYDFFRMCEMCEINLQLTDYAKSLLENPELLK